ncbi:hypothetical protein ABW21_db0206066 [Orbilia brochopaga]|nr:hypothetical protein ABW21_db0206066 [Drechslerella brochopaga]
MIRTKTPSPKKARPATFLSPQRLAVYNLSPTKRPSQSGTLPTESVEREPSTVDNDHVPSYLLPGSCGYGGGADLPVVVRRDLAGDFPEIKTVYLHFPWIILECPQGPPASPPSRIGCFPAIYVEDVETFYNADGHRTLIYSGPRTKDPWPQQLDHFRCPEDKDLLRMLGGMPNAVGVEFSYNKLTFTLTKLNTSYQYPGRIGGIWAQYKTEDSPGPTISPRSERLITPLVSEKIRDDTDYWPKLHPGVMLHDKTRFCTAGLLLRNNWTGQLCVTTSNHTFPNDEVFHADKKIGTIKHRFPESDVCLFELAPDVDYTNSDYFEASPPTGLLRLPPGGQRQWVECDSVTTGLQSFMLTGRALKLEAAYNLGDEFELNPVMAEIESMVSFRGSVAVGNLQLESSVTARGICGSPLQLTDEPSEGICLGFFWRSDNLKHYFADVSFLVDAGWELVRELDETEASTSLEKELL